MNVKLTKITPEIAKEMLKKNIGNRPINRKHVDKLVKEMVNDRWKVNGDTICMNNDRLIDGQHRLQAVVQSGVTIATLIVEGLSSDVFDTKDVGKRRSAGDVLGIAGEINATRLASALVMIDRYFTGRVHSHTNYSNTEVEELLVKYPEARNSIQRGVTGVSLLMPSVLDACHYLFSRKDPEMADDFVNKVLRGAGLVEGSPWYILREKLVNNSLSKAKLRKPYLMALCIKAWNHVRMGTTFKHLKYTESGPGAESFPLVR